MKNTWTALLALGLLALVMGCGNSTVPSTPATGEQPDSLAPNSATATPAVDSSRYIPATYRPEAVQLVTGVLQKMYAADLAINLIDSFSRSFCLFEFDMNGDGSSEIWVQHNGTYFCGTGGCTLMLLSQQGKAITTFTVSETPVVIANESNKGWRNIYINHKGKYRLLTFDGKSYPANPSLIEASDQIPGDGLPRLFDTANEPYPVFRF